MLKEIKQYSNTLKEFINYLTESGVVLNDFYSKDIKFRIGFYIDFLDKHNITVMADCYNYAVYYDREIPESVMHLRLKKSEVIAESTNTDIDSKYTIIDNYKDAIIAAFKHLETPF